MAQVSLLSLHAYPCTYAFGRIPLRQDAAPSRRDSTRAQAGNKQDLAGQTATKQQRSLEKYQNPVLNLLGKLLPAGVRQDKAGDDPATPAVVTKQKHLSIEAMRDEVEAGLRKHSWFVTGQVKRELFADNFVFKDPDVMVEGVENYAKGVAKLFDERSTLQLISTKVQDSKTIEIKWRLAAYINLPFRPKLKPYIVTSYYTTDSEGLICRQEDLFSIPGWEILLSIFLPNFGTPPAPPVV